MRNKPAIELNYLEEFESYQSLYTTLVQGNLFNPQKQDSSESTPEPCLKFELLETLRKYTLSKLEKRECIHLHQEELKILITKISQLKELVLKLRNVDELVNWILKLMRSHQMFWHAQSPIHQNLVNQNIGYGYPNLDQKLVHPIECGCEEICLKQPV